MEWNTDTLMSLDVLKDEYIAVEFVHFSECSCIIKVHNPLAKFDGKQNEIFLTLVKEHNSYVLQEPINYKIDPKKRDRTYIIIGDSIKKVEFTSPYDVKNCDVVKNVDLKCSDVKYQGRIVKGNLVLKEGSKFNRTNTSNIDYPTLIVNFIY